MSITAEETRVDQITKLQNARPKIAALLSTGSTDVPMEDAYRKLRFVMELMIVATTMTKVGLNVQTLFARVT